MPLVTTRAGAGSFGLGWGAAAGEEELGGMVLLKPTSIAYSGTSASINANGSVQFTSLSSLSLNGVFSSGYDNYIMSIRTTTSPHATAINMRLRNSGTDATGTDYTYQRLEVSATFLSGARATSDNKTRINNSSTLMNGDEVRFYGPYLAKPTAIGNEGGSSQGGAGMVDVASTHSLSNQYDGFTIYSDSPVVLSGRISVYGMVGA